MNFSKADFHSKKFRSKLATFSSEMDNCKS